MKIGDATRAALLEHGLRIAKEKGLRGVGVRGVARAAGVNAGSFVYHFGGRDEFLTELVQGWYEPFAEKLEALAAEPGGTTYARLEKVLIAQARLIASESALIAHLVMDAAAGEPAARSFLLEVPARHPKLIIGLIQRAQRDGELIAGHPAHLGQFLIGSVWYPMLVVDGLLRDRDWIPAGLDELIALVRDPDAAVERLGWALAGLRAR